jgi:hypothetical protein
VSAPAREPHALTVLKRARVCITTGWHPTRPYVERTLAAIDEYVDAHRELVETDPGPPDPEPPAPEPADPALVAEFLGWLHALNGGTIVDGVGDELGWFDTYDEFARFLGGARHTPAEFDQHWSRGHEGQPRGVRVPPVPPDPAP